MSIALTSSHLSPPHCAATLRKPQHFTPCISPHAQYVPIYHHAPCHTPLHPDTLAGPLAIPCGPHLRARELMLRYWHHTMRLVSPTQPPLPAPPLTHFHVLCPTIPMPHWPSRLTNAPASQCRAARTNHHAPSKSHAATMPRPTTDTPPGPAATNTMPRQPRHPAAPTCRMPTPGPVQPLPICLQMVGSGKVLLTFCEGGQCWHVPKPTAACGPHLLRSRRLARWAKLGAGWRPLLPARHLESRRPCAGRSHVWWRV